MWEKMSLHEESVRVPLILAGPQIEPAETDALVEHLDLYPTLAKLAGLPLPEHLQGRSLVPVLNDSSASVRDAVYTLRRRNDHLLRNDRWAYLRYANGSEELYDMQEDPYQFHNLAGHAEHSKVLQTMRQALEAKLVSVGE